ncbi:hypothetical protein BY996DRAFT_8526600 [Phakopsora pachyrhizi]|nr:hypothetical protein BY996DRAFT_8526600 [Phakopsora pachyrhizi]
MAPIPHGQSQLWSLNLPKNRTNNSPHLPPQSRIDDSDSLLNQSDSSFITTSTITGSHPNLSSLQNSPNSNLSKTLTTKIQETPRKGIKDLKVGEHPNHSSQGMEKELLKTEPDGGNVASRGVTSLPKIIDISEPDNAQEVTGVTQDEFSGESSCLLSEEEEEQEENNKENGKDNNEGEYEDCDGRIDTQAAQKFKTNLRVSSQYGQEKEQLPDFRHPKGQVHLLKDNDDYQATEKINIEDQDPERHLLEKNQQQHQFGRRRQLILRDFSRLLNLKENKKNSRVKIKDEILFKELPKVNMDQKCCLRDESLNDYERASSRQLAGNFKYEEEGKKKFFIFERIKVEIHIDRLRLEFINDVNCQMMIEFDWREGWSKHTCYNNCLVELGAQSINDGFDRGKTERVLLEIEARRTEHKTRKWWREQCIDTYVEDLKIINNSLNEVFNSPNDLSHNCQAPQMSYQQEELTESVWRPSSLDC